jgi:N-acylneuraminate cytidylyltransferase
MFSVEDLAVGEPIPKVARKGEPKIDRSRIYAVVPARAGSKGVKGKNIKDFCGKPLMAWSIENGIKSKYISRTFVSTDSEEYRKVALQHGAEAPFLRPVDISHDTATDVQFCEHFLRWFKENEPEKQPSLLVQLRPTCPCLSVEMLDDAIKTFLDHEDEGFDSLRSVTPADHEPFNMYWMDPEGSGLLLPLLPKARYRDEPSKAIPEPQSVARQVLPQLFWNNAYIDIIRPRTVLEQGSCIGKRPLAYKMTADDNVDIDTPEQWAAAEVRKRAQLEAAARNEP